MKKPQLLHEIVWMKLTSIMLSKKSKHKNLYTIDIKSKNQAKTHIFHDMTGQWLCLGGWSRREERESFWKGSHRASGVLVMIFIFF